MKSLHLLYALVVVAASAFFGIDPASAQTRTFISGVGNDADPCSRTAPCRTFAGAISKTAAGGEINCLDPGGYGSVTITKSITIDCTGTFGSALNSSVQGVLINDAASGAPRTIKVTLRGISIQGAPPASPGLNGIRFVSGASLIVQDVIIQNQNAAAANGNGIKIEPSAGTAEIFINDTHIIRNGVAGVSGNGILAKPTGSGSANLFIQDSSLTDNDTGLTADITTTTGFVSVSIMNSAITGNRNGIVATGDASGSVQVNVMRSMLSGSVTGINAVAPGVVRIGDSMLTSNVTTLSGNVFSYGNNQIAGNGSNGASTPIAPLGNP